jgi:hypothetical protein
MRYELAELHNIDGVRSIALRSTNREQDFTYRRYVPRERERYDDIAYDQYGSPREWHRIADANPEQLYPIPMPGVRIRVPDADLL